MIDKNADPWKNPISKNSDVGSIMTPIHDINAIPKNSGCGLILPSYNGRLRNGNCKAAMDWNIISMPHKPTRDVTTARNPLRPGIAYANANGAPKQK